MGKTSKALGKSGYSLDVEPKPDMAKRAGGSVISLENTANRHAEDESVSREGLTRAPDSSDAPIEIPKSSPVSSDAPIEIPKSSPVPSDAPIKSPKSSYGFTGARMESPKISSVSAAEWDERLSKVTSLSSRTAESFRVLRSKILLPQDGRPAPKTIMVSSALPREGKSFVSANLGVALAQGMDQHSLVIDCDLRAPSLAPLFGIPSERGLVDYLQGKEDLSSLIWKTSLEKLSILPSGLPPVNPADLLGSERMQNLVAELASRYPDRYVIFDTPPLEVASESKVLSQTVDGVVLVVRQGVSNRPLIEKFIADIGKDRIIGVIFNGHKSNFISTRLVDKSHYYYGKYYKAKE